MEKNQPWWQEIDVSKDTLYPCDNVPSYKNDHENRCYITAKSQIRIREWGQENWQVFAPSLYQSSMNPERKEIRTLMVEERKGVLILKTAYKEQKLNLENMEIEVSAWVPQIRKVDCKHCENCGRCGW